MKMLTAAQLAGISTQLSSNKGVFRKSKNFKCNPWPSYKILVNIVFVRYEEVIFS